MKARISDLRNEVFSCSASSSRLAEIPSSKSSGCRTSSWTGMGLAPPDPARWPARYRPAFIRRLICSRRSASSTVRHRKPG